MPRNKKQELIFGIIMSYVMAYGMEDYNIAISQGIDLAPGGFSNMTNHVFGDALKEAGLYGAVRFYFFRIFGETTSAPPLPPGTATQQRITPTYVKFCVKPERRDPICSNLVSCAILKSLTNTASRRPSMIRSFSPKDLDTIMRIWLGGQSGCPPLYFAGLLDFPKPPGSGTASTGKDFGVGIRGDRPSLCRNAGGIPSRNFRRPLLSFQRNRRRTFPAAQILLSIIPPERI